MRGGDWGKGWKVEEGDDAIQFSYYTYYTANIWFKVFSVSLEIALFNGFLENWIIFVPSSRDQVMKLAHCAIF